MRYGCDAAKRQDYAAFDEDAARRFIYACYEVKVDLDVNPETGDAKIVRVDDREVAK